MAARRLMTLLCHACTTLAAVALIVMMLATDWDIFARQAFGQPLHGVVELVEITVLASTMLALPATFLRDEQIKVDLLDTWASAARVRLAKIAGLLLTIILLALLSWNTIAPMRDALQFGDLKPDLGVPLHLLHGLILAAFVMSLFACLVALWAELLGEAGPSA